jgi:hypothetical protein
VIAMTTALPPMSTTDRLPPWLPDYLPGRIHAVAPDLWPVTGMAGHGIAASLPRYGLEVFCRRPEIDPARVRWLLDRAVRPRETLQVVLVHHRRLYVVDGHHVLAAHLVGGSERIPVRFHLAGPLPLPMPRQWSPVTPAS